MSSKVQARMAFSSYLHRLQLRLLAESRADRSPAWTQKEHDQMETKQMVESLDRIPDEGRCIHSSVSRSLFWRRVKVTWRKSLRSTRRSVFPGTKCDSSGVERNSDNNREISGLCVKLSLCVDGDPLSAQKGNYQLLFTIQQQKLRSKQLLDQSHTRHQAILSAYTLTTLTPKPPSSAPRDRRMHKIITHSLHKKAISEPPAGQSSASGQHVVYETLCANTGLSVYSKLFHTQGSRNR